MTTRIRIAYAAVAALLVGSLNEARGQGPNPTVNYTDPAVPYVQDFDGLRIGGTGTPGAILNSVDTAPYLNPSPPPTAEPLVGWRHRTTQSTRTFIAGSGTGTQGSGYSFGPAGETDRAFGLLTSGTSLNGIVGVIIRNNTGAAIPAVEVQYTGEQWRFAGRTDNSRDRLDFAYQLGMNELNTLDSGAGLTQVDELDFQSPVFTGSMGALDGNLPANQQSFTHVITFGGTGWENGQDLLIQWRDFDVSPGGDDGLAIDNFRVIAFAPVPEPGAVLLACGLVGGAATGARRFRRGRPVVAG